MSAEAQERGLNCCARSKFILPMAIVNAVVCGIILSFYIVIEVFDGIVKETWMDWWGNDAMTYEL